MIILRQKSYSKQEFKWALGSIGKGALLGAGAGAFLRRKRLAENPKGFLLGTGIGAAVGAGLGTAVYINGYKERRRLKKEEPHKQEVDEIIKTNFSWALEYLKDLDEKLLKEDKKLEELGKKLLLDDFASDQIYFNLPLSNNCCNLSDYIADFDIEEDTYLNPKKSRFIKYNELSGDLELYEGYPIAAFYDHKNDKLVCSIKNKSQLRSVIKKYYFDEILYTIDNLMNHIGSSGLDYGEYTLMTENPDDLSENQYFKALNTYFNEIKRFIKTL